MSGDVIDMARRPRDDWPEGDPGTVARLHDWARAHSDEHEALRELAARLDPRAVVEPVVVGPPWGGPGEAGWAVYGYLPGGPEVIGAVGDCGLVLSSLREAAAWRERARAMRASAAERGHDVLPSFLYGFRDTDVRELGPDDYGPDANGGYATCYPGCPGCEP